MANTILFINEEYIKDNSEVQDNLDIKKMMRSVQIVQRTFIQQTLGTALYNDYITRGTSGFTDSNYITLRDDYIKPMVLEYSLYKALPFMNYSLTNKAVVKKEADNTIATELDELKFLQAQYKDSADFIGQRCIKYLMQSYNDGLFPLYSCAYNEDLDEIKPQQDSPYYYGGIYLGDVID